MPVVRFRAVVITMMIIALTALQSTIAKPLEVGEGESAGEEIQNFQPVSRTPQFQQRVPFQHSGFGSNYDYSGYRNPFMNFMSGSNVQISYRDENGEEIPADADYTPEDAVARRFVVRQKVNQPVPLYQARQLGVNSMPSQNRQFPTNNFRLLNNEIQLVNPKYVASVPLTPLNYDKRQENVLENAAQQQPNPPISQRLDYASEKQSESMQTYEAQPSVGGEEDSDDKILEKVDSTLPVTDTDVSVNEVVDIPAQDVGEAEDEAQSRNQFIINEGDLEEPIDDETLDTASSNNYAYSYSTFYPAQPVHYQQPQQPQGRFQQQVLHQQEQQPDHFQQQQNNYQRPANYYQHIVHYQQPDPSANYIVLRGTRPKLVLQELKALQLQLDQSPIMNALFSPATVPVPPTTPAWPSKYEAQKYLPPNTLMSAQTSVHPNTRRAVIKVDTENPDPKALEQLRNLNLLPTQPKSKSIANSIQESISQNAAAFSNYVNANLRFQQPEILSRAFDSNSQVMHSFFNNQLRVPQFSSFPNFQQSQGQAIIQNNFVPAFAPSEPKAPKVPYISPSLRVVDIDPVDDIDVRMDMTPDSELDVQKKNNLQSAPIIQIGNNNRNIQDVSHGLVQILPGEFVQVQGNFVIPPAHDETLAGRDSSIPRQNADAENFDNERNTGGDDSSRLPKLEDETEDFVANSTQDKVFNDNTSEQPKLNDGEDSEAQVAVTDMNDQQNVNDNLQDYTGNDETTVMNDRAGNFYDEATDTNFNDDAGIMERASGLEVMNQVRENSTSAAVTNTTEKVQNLEVTTLDLPVAVTVLNDSVDSTTTEVSDETTTESADESTTDPSTEETTTEKFSLDDRLNIETVRSLVG